MKYVETGSGQLPFITLVSILSISLVVNLPGLAVSPLMDELDKVFPTVSKLEIQLLTILPNLFIIPFVLWSGKLSVSKNKIVILVVGLCIYVLSAILYFFANSMTALIIISCFLGIGCGAVIPLAAGLIAEYFTGHYRMKQLGIKSGIANFTLIFATFLVGWLGNNGWHYPFLVYLTPAIPLLLTPFISRKFIGKYGHFKVAASDSGIPSVTPEATEFHFKGKQSKHLLIGVLIFYFLITYGNIVISYYLPFSMQKYGLGSTEVGIVTSLFFLSITLPGFFLPFIIKICKHMTSFLAVLLIAGGLFIMGIEQTYGFYILSVMMVGAGYGILQPIIYDKTTYIAPDSTKATQYLSYVLSGNYVAITVAPFFISLMGFLLGIHTNSFPYFLNGVIMVLLAICCLIFYKSFVFRVDPGFYEKDKVEITN